MNNPGGRDLYCFGGEGGFPIGLTDLKIVLLYSPFFAASAAEVDAHREYLRALDAQ